MCVAHGGGVAATVPRRPRARDEDGDTPLRIARGLGGRGAAALLERAGESS